MLTEYVIDIAWQGVLYDLYSHEPEGWSPEGEGLYKPDSMNLPCYMCYISVTSHMTRTKEFEVTVLQVRLPFTDWFS